MTQTTHRKTTRARLASILKDRYRGLDANEIEARITEQFGHADAVPSEQATAFVATFLDDDARASAAKRRAEREAMEARRSQAYIDAVIQTTNGEVIPAEVLEKVTSDVNKNDADFENDVAHVLKRAKRFEQLEGFKKQARVYRKADDELRKVEAKLSEELDAIRAKFAEDLKRLKEIKDKHSSAPNLASSYSRDLERSCRDSSLETDAEKLASPY